MSNIDKQSVQAVADLKAGYTLGHADVAMLNELARIALASLEVEPIGFRCRRSDNLGDWSYVYHREPDDFERKHLVIEGIYTAPPAPVSRDEMTPKPAVLDKRTWLFYCEKYPEMPMGDAIIRSVEWNACRAAMLQGKSEQPQNAQQNIPENIPGGNSPVTPDGWISCSERMPVIGELNWRTSFPLLVTCEIGVIPAYYGFVSVNGDRHYGFMESLKYGDDNGNHPQTNEYGLISNVTHWMPLPEPPQEVK
ncbi:TPA: DUF551 domain-containing protein [Escherichia coli]